MGATLLIFHIINFTSSTEIQYIPSSVNSQDSTLTVDVQGAVNKPGVVRLPGGSRIEDAIAAAGGFSEEADQEYIRRQMNLAAKVVDGTKIYLPYQGESNQSNVSNVVNLNTASQKELESLPGIGPVTAEKIIAGRPYGTIEELMERKIIGKAVFEKIKERISVY